MMKDFKKIIIAMIVACVIAASIPVSGSSVDAATIKVKSGADVTDVKDSSTGKKIAYKNGGKVTPKKGWYRNGNTQYYFDGKKNYATYVWYNKADKWYLAKWNKSKKAYKRYTGYAGLSNGKTYKFSKGVKGKKASGVVKVGNKYYYYKDGKQTVYSKSCGKWKTGKTQYYFGKGNKSATYVYYSGQKVLKKWNKSSKQYVNYNKAFTLSNGTKYVFNNGNRGTIKSSITAGTDKTTAVYKDASNKPKKKTGWKLVKGVQYYFNNAATASFKIEKGVCYSFASSSHQATGDPVITGEWTVYNGVVDGVYYDDNGKVKPAEKGAITTDQSGLLVKYDGKEWKLLTGTYKGLYYVKGDFASGVYGGKYYKKGKLATGICDGKFYKDGVLGTGSYNGKRYSKGSLLTGIYKGKYYKDGVLGTGTYDSKFYKNGELYTGNRKSNGKYYVNGALANGTYGGVKYVDGVAQKAEQHVCKWLVVLDKNQNPVQSNYKKHDAVMGTENQMIRDAWDEPIYAARKWLVCNTCSGELGIDDQDCAYENTAELDKHQDAVHHGGNHLVKKIIDYKHHDAEYADVSVTEKRAYEEWDKTYKCTVCGDTMTVHVVCGDIEGSSGEVARIPSKSGELVWDDGTSYIRVTAGKPYTSTGSILNKKLSTDEFFKMYGYVYIGPYADLTYEPDTNYLTLLKDHGFIK